MTERDLHPVDYLPELALGVLPAEVAPGIREHVSRCTTCEAELAEMQRVADLLPLAVEDVEPAGPLRESVLDRVAREPRPLAARRRQPAPAWRLPAAAAAALLLAVAAGLGGFFAGRGTVDDGSAFEQLAARQSTLLDATAQGQVSVAHGKQGPAEAALVRAPGVAGGYLMVGGLPALPGGKAYQAWLSRDGQHMEPSTVFTDAGGHAWLESSAPLDQYVLMAFTIEDSGGAAQPTATPFLIVDLKKTVMLP